MQDCRKIRPLASCFFFSVPLCWPTLWQNRILLDFLVSNYIVHLCLFITNLFVAQREEKYSSSLDDTGSPVTHSPARLSKNLVFCLFVALLHWCSEPHCNECSSAWSCNNWHWFFLVATPLSHHQLISVLIWKYSEASRGQKIRRTHLPSITWVLLLDIYRKNWERVCCRTVGPGTNVTTQ